MKKRGEGGGGQIMYTRVSKYKNDKIKKKKKQIPIIVTCRPRIKS
jgi:hypothetical protein